MRYGKSLTKISIKEGNRNVTKQNLSSSTLFLDSPKHNLIADRELKFFSSNPESERGVQLTGNALIYSKINLKLLKSWFPLESPSVGLCNNNRSMNPDQFMAFFVKKRRRKKFLKDSVHFMPCSLVKV